MTLTEHTLSNLKAELYWAIMADNQERRAELEAEIAKLEEKK